MTLSTNFTKLDEKQCYVLDKLVTDETANYIF